MSQQLFDYYYIGTITTIEVVSFATFLTSDNLNKEVFPSIYASSLNLSFW